jgi:beta-N-acetylhexosaminidase
MILLSAFFIACAPGSTAVSGFAGSDEAWVNSTLQRLSLRDKVAQLVMPRIPGGFLAADGPAFERIRGWVEDQHVGGVIATVGPPMEAATTFDLLQSLAHVPLLVTADLEEGPGQLLNGGVVLPWGLDNGGATRFPPLMALGATGEEAFAHALGRISALEGRAVGVHMTFAPVVDVNNNPANPIINTRSFGAEPALVARMAAAHVRGVQDNGMLATAKHFPGHGDTGTDSHIELPVITVGRARADSIELVPYRAAIAAGVAAVMTAHIAFPALTGDSVPATLARAILTGLLREELGFDGIITTDAMDMGAIVRNYGATVAPVMALAAGADLLLQVPGNDVATVIDAVVDAVRSGELTESRIDASVRRLLAAKARLGLHRNARVDLTRVPYALARAEHLAMAQEAADRSITLARDETRMIPLRDGSTLAIVYVGYNDPYAGRTFTRALDGPLQGLRTVTLESQPSAADLVDVRRMADQADRIIFAPFIRVGAYRPDLSVADSVAAVITDLASRKPTALVSFGNPYVLGQFPHIGTYMLAWGQGDVSQRAAARALTGQIAITGRLPIPIPPFHAIGDGITVSGN